MTTAQAPSRITQEEYDRLLHEPGVEYAAGQILEKPMSMKAAMVAATIVRLLGNEAENGAAVVFSEALAYRCYPDDPSKFRKPDVSLIRGERLAGIDLDAGFCPIPADLVVEVLSPNDIASDVVEKVEEYLGAGFPLIWVVDPRTRTVAAHHPDLVRQLRAADEITGEAALPGFRRKVAEFFAPPPAAAAATA